jgi:hypothetical protein
VCCLEVSNGSVEVWDVVVDVQDGEVWMAYSDVAMGAWL